MIKYRRKPVKDYLAGVARTIPAPTLSRNGTNPAKDIIVNYNFVKTF
jgi:hypothetical protein